MKAQYLRCLIALTISLSGCSTKLVGTQDIIGHWASTSITYPNDPIFNEIHPDTTAGSATFWFRPGCRLICSPLPKTLEGYSRATAEANYFEFFKIDSARFFVQASVRSAIWSASSTSAAVTSSWKPG